jgi:hypothetical protein
MIGFKINSFYICVSVYYKLSKKGKSVVNSSEK